MATSSYAFAVGNVRARETALLKKQDIFQLLSFKTPAEAVGYLRDKGFAYPDTPDADLFKAEEQKLWEYIREVAPDFSVFSGFILQNDCHNIKSVLKCMSLHREYKELILSPYTVEPDKVYRAVSERKFSELGDDISDGVKEAADALLKIGDPQLADAVLDGLFMKLRLKSAEKLKLSMLETIIKTSVFYDNIKAAIRCARAKKSVAFCEACLIDTPELSKKDLIPAVLKGPDEVLALLEKASALGSAEAAAAYKRSPSEFEKTVDDLLMSVAVKAKYVAVGAEPLIAYLQARLCEIKVARIVVNGITIGEDEEKVREMLREVYG